MIQLLPMTPATAAIRIALRNNWNTWLADSKLVTMKRLTVRMTKANLNIYRQHLKKAVSLAPSMAMPKKAGTSQPSILLTPAYSRSCPKTEYKKAPPFLSYISCFTHKKRGC